MSDESKFLSIGMIVAIESGLQKEVQECEKVFADASEKYKSEAKQQLDDAILALEWIRIVWMQYNK